MTTKTRNEECPRKEVTKAAPGGGLTSPITTPFIGRAQEHQRFSGMNGVTERRVYKVCRVCSHDESPTERTLAVLGK